MNHENITLSKRGQAQKGKYAESMSRGLCGQTASVREGERVLKQIVVMVIRTVWM